MECFLLAPQWMSLHASQSAWSPLWRPLTQMPLAAFIYSAAKSLQSCPTLCDPTDGSLPGSPIPGILQARTLEWVAISLSNAWKWKVKVKSLSRVRLSDPMDCSLPGTSIHGIFQARVLEWGAIAFSVIYSNRGESWEMFGFTFLPWYNQTKTITCLYIDILWFTMELWPD